MNIDEARSKIREFAQNCIRLSKHCRQRMRERGVTMDDYLQVLMWGEVISVEESSESGDCKCTIEGKDIDGDHLILKVAVLEKDYAVLCITVHG